MKFYMYFFIILLLVIIVPVLVKKYKDYKARIKREKWQSEMRQHIREKYAHFTDQQKKEMYQEVLEIQKAEMVRDNECNKSRNRIQENPSFDELISRMAKLDAPDMLRESFKKKYGITLRSIEYEIEYLQKYK